MKKVLCTFIVSVMLLCGCSVATFAQSDEIQNVDVEIIFAPITARITFGGAFSPVGVVLKVTYPDGKTEILTVERIDNGNYRAGNFKVTAEFFMIELAIFWGGTIQGFGVQNVPIILNYESDDGTVYQGSVMCDFINLPSLTDILLPINQFFYSLYHAICFA